MENGKRDVSFFHGHKRNDPRVFLILMIKNTSHELFSPGLEMAPARLSVVG